MEIVNGRLEAVEAQSNNNAIYSGAISRNQLGKDDFLKILITQLQNQNPISPIDDKEFIAQMAQFSTLEQMTNLSQSFSELTQASNASQSLSLLGKQVEIDDGGVLISGTVTHVTFGNIPHITVGSQQYEIGQITRISQNSNNEIDN